MTLSYATGFALAPLALFVPPPWAVAVRGSALCRVLLVLSVALALAGAALMAWGPWWPGMTLGGLAMVSVMLMFWTAAEPRERREDDEGGDDEGGGGGPPPSGPRAPQGPVVDWSDLDRQRVPEPV